MRSLGSEVSPTRLEGSGAEDREQVIAPPPDLFAEELIASLIDDRRFVPRQWLVDRVQEHLEGSDARFVLLTGEPGAGKSAVMAHLARLQPEAPRYFIRRDSIAPLRGGEARTFLFALGHQLASLHPSLFDPRRLEVVIRQRAERIVSGGQVVGIEVEDLVVSPFHETAIRVEQHAAVVEGDLVGISANRMTLEPRLLELSNLQYLALLDPAEVLAEQDPTARIVVLLDALDEIRYGLRGEDVLDWLTTCPELPPNVRFVLTSRPDTDLLRSFRDVKGSEITELTIDPDAEEDRANIREDLHRYLDRFAAEPAVAEAMVTHEVEPASFVDGATDRAQGNFQYAVALARGIDAALGSEPPSEDLAVLFRLEGIPAGTQELYRFFLGKIKEQADRAPVKVPTGPLSESEERPAWEALYHPVLAVLAVAFEPLAAEQLVAYASVPPGTLPRAMRAMAQFMDPLPDGRYRLYHATFPEFLTGEETGGAADPFHVDPATWHGLLAGRLLRGNPDWLACEDDYALAHTPAHLVEAIRRQAAHGTEARARRAEVEGTLANLLTDFDFIVQSVSRLGVDRLLTDLGEASELVPTASSPDGERNGGTTVIGGPARPSLPSLARALTQGAYRLRVARDVRSPIQVAFAIALQALELGENHVATAARERLQETSESQVIPEWARSNVTLTPLYELRGQGAMGAGVGEVGQRLLVAFWDLQGAFSVWWPDTNMVTAVPELDRRGIELTDTRPSPEMAAALFLKTGQVCESFAGAAGASAFAEYRSTVYVAESDPAGQIWVRPLGSPPLWSPVGDFATGLRLERTEAQDRSAPVAKLAGQQITELHFAVGPDRAPTLAAVTDTGDLFLLHPFDEDESRGVARTEVHDADRNCLLSSVACGLTSLLAVATDSRPVVLIDVNTGLEVDSLSWASLPESGHDLVEEVAFVAEELADCHLPRLIIRLRSGDVLLWDRQQVYGSTVSSYGVVAARRSGSRSLLLTDTAHGLRVWDLAEVFTPRSEASGQVILVAAAEVGSQRSVAWISETGDRPRLIVGSPTDFGCEISADEPVTRHPELLAIGSIDEEVSFVVCETFWPLFEVFRHGEELTRETGPDRDSWPSVLSRFNPAAIAFQRKAVNQLRAPAFLARAVGPSPLQEFDADRVVSDSSLSSFAAFAAQAPGPDRAIAWRRGSSQTWDVPLGGWMSPRGTMAEAVGCLGDTLFLAVVEKGSGRTLIFKSRPSLSQPTELPQLSGNLRTVATFVYHGDQILLAIGDAASFSLYPVTRGSVAGQVEIPLVPTALFSAPSRLLVGTPDGVVSLRIR